MSFIIKHWRKFAMATSLALSFALGYWSNKPKESIVSSEHSSESTLEKEISSNKKHKIKVITKKPDGSTEVVEIDKGKKETTRESNSNKKTNKTLTETKNRPNYKAGMFVKNKLELKWEPVYGAVVGRRLFDNFWLDVFAEQSKTAGIGVSAEF
ncbi:MAG: hypothetical protein NC829_03195 [Candidatus Omnitrophica bacterium]|nr:hypothetical protein [Candidatus Omnitrophota bacterium]